MAKGGSTAKTATYVYCVVRVSAKTPPDLGKKSPRGLLGTKKPRLVDAGAGYWLLVGEAPLDQYNAEEIDTKLRDLDWVGGRASEHEAVVEHATSIAKATVIPMKLFTLFASDERAIDHVKKIKKSLDRIVSKIEGCEEWGLRILFDEQRAAARAAEEALAKKVVTGKDFLLRKKSLDDDRRKAGARGAARVDELFEALSKVASQARRRPAPNRELAGRVLLDAVLLVKRGASVTKVKKTVEGAAKGLVEEGFDITLTGPWPAYSFIG